MFKHILIATDGSRLAEMAAGHGLELAKQLNAKVTVVTVTEPWTEPYGTAFPPSWAQVHANAAAENAASILASVSDIAKRKRVPCATHHVPDQHPAEGIIETADTKECDLIVWPHTAGTVWPSCSAPAKVVALGNISVLICRKQ